LHHNVQRRRKRLTGTVPFASSHSNMSPVGKSVKFAVSLPRITKAHKLFAAQGLAAKPQWRCSCLQSSSCRQIGLVQINHIERAKRGGVVFAARRAAAPNKFASQPPVSWGDSNANPATSVIKARQNQKTPLKARSQRAVEESFPAALPALSIRLPGVRHRVGT
jgi:hypothetical protein